ncbi:DUF1304 domain-containing protein [Propioniciclava sp.]|uniref:DUF1304 domain-containing protein n=1 Tax=Propioniciclava sp. TaxID=2038686 RepID=UPI00261CD2A0|nr:DUF1304 domain-containing protein [Propioniciclava sp.]
MIVVALVLAVLAALLHGFIFYLESLAWTTPRARAVFGTSAEGAAATKEMAFNQGFYNLFLAIVTVVGVVLHATGSPAAGVALVFAGVGSMLAAALVLFLSAPDKRGAALKQGTLPLLAVLLLAAGLLV